MTSYTTEDVLKLLAVMTDEERAQFDSLIGEDYDRVWRPTPGPQLDAYNSNADLLLYGGAAGGGKGFPVGTNILTPHGWKTIEQLKKGSALCAPDGTVTRVIGVFHRGVQPLYRLTFSDGASIVCDADHIWLAWESRGSRKVGNARTSGEAGAKKWTTSDIVAHYAAGKPNLMIPTMSAPSAFNVAGSLVGPGVFQKRVVPPYVLGVLLGDGYLNGPSVSFYSADPEIAERVARELGTTLSEYETGSTAKQYRIPNAAVLGDLKALGVMGHTAETKTIPRIYLFGSADERWALLQGLMDTDGWAEEGRAAYFTTVSPQLADDVRHLARSLGAIVTTTTKTPTYTHNGETREGKLAYCLRIKMPDLSRAFYLERKRELLADKTFQSMGRTLDHIEPAGEGETICIAVDSPASLFVTEHFLVTHNTDLLLGLALNEHERSVIFRRQFTDLRGIEDRLLQIVGDQDYNRTDKRWRRKDQVIEFGHLERPGSELSWQGRPHDFIGFDEGAQLQETKVSFVMGWLRSAKKGRRCRVVIASNPPIGGEGMWLIEWFAPWLDPNYPNPAKPGELRYAVLRGRADRIQTIWVDGPAPVEIDGETYIPLSRTYIPARLDDNPFLRDTAYRAQINAMPEPLRSQLLYGDFTAAAEDAAMQVIPSEWIDAAIRRWRAKPVSDNEHMLAMSIDPSGTGSDPTVIGRLYRGNRFGEIIEIPRGPAGSSHETAAAIVAYRRSNADVSIDYGGGWGTGIRDYLQNNLSTPCEALNAQEASGDATTDQQLFFGNLRAEWWWRFREALDPASGEDIALPPDPRLRAQLIAPTWRLKGDEIWIESKDDIRKRLGSSTDRADVVIQCWHRRAAATRRLVTTSKIVQTTVEEYDPWALL